MRCENSSDLIKLKEILIHLNKPKICKKKTSDYTVALHS